MRYSIITAVLASLTVCNWTWGQTQFQAFLDASQVVSTTSTTTATATATFELSADESMLSYSVDINGLDLKQNPGDRNQPNDVVAIHLHNGAAGSTGPHVLNIFGVPSMDDADLVIDYANDSFSGIWDDGDVVDPSPAAQSMDGPTKFLSNFVDELKAGNIYLAVHNYDATAPGPAGFVAIRGQLVPEPTTLALTALAFACCGCIRRSR